MKAILQDLNDNLKVKSLCRNFPMRVQELIDAIRRQRLLFVGRPSRNNNFSGNPKIAITRNAMEIVTNRVR